MQLVSYLVIALSTLYLAALVFGWFQRSRVTAQMANADKALFEAQADLILERKREVQKESELSWDSFRKFELVKKEMEATDICSFYLAPHDRRPLPPFRPGQYLTFKLNIPGQKKPVIRCYSLSDSAYNDKTYRLTIKKVPPPRDQPDAPPGLSSNFFHDALQEMDIIDVKAPSGHFFFELDRPHPAVLIGGGIGLTPVLSMVNSMVDAGYNKETWFFYGVRNRGEHAMKEHLRQLDEAHDWLHMHVCYSAPGEDDVKGEDFQNEGRVSVELFKELLPSNNYDFYMCGPPPMMQSVVADLEAWGVPEERIHFEAFGPASVKGVKQGHEADEPKKDSSETFTVEFAKSGQTLQWTGEFDSILEFAEEHDVAIDFGCRAGNCGSCLTAIKDGAVELVQEIGADCEKGSCLACVSIPKTHIVLDA
ncbi:MAG: 2Fe-2S iron-sulfur cluster binding domain-containing protein [Gammaproteobacteria bacterium]|nr:2Fe-2S iron-sulfur cluster binding domain-containing protein [Gammaproteobacteria bacterium]